MAARRLVHDAYPLGDACWAAEAKDDGPPAATANETSVILRDDGSQVVLNYPGPAPAVHVDDGGNIRINF